MMWPYCGLRGLSDDYLVDHLMVFSTWLLKEIKALSFYTVQTWYYHLVQVNQSEEDSQDG